MIPRGPLRHPDQQQALRTHHVPTQTRAGCVQRPPRPSERFVSLGSSVVSLAGVPEWL